MELIKNQSSFQLKGSLFTLTVLQLLEPDLATLTTDLLSMVKQTPNFFNYTPMVIELHTTLQGNLNLNTVFFVELCQILRAHKIIPVGIRNGSEQHNAAAIEANLAIFPMNKTETTSQPSHKKIAVSKPLAEYPNKLITQPVRSGQQVYAKGGDLIIVAPVGYGAELLADGHIHVYGPLRGRALAGIKGDTNARIFCHSLEAELLSIAGHYRVNEDFKQTNENKFTQIYLENEQLKIATI